MGIYDRWNPESRLLRFYHAKIPLVRTDLENGAFGHLVQILATYPKFREMDRDVLSDNVSFGFGYQGYAHLLHNVPDTFDINNFPYQEWQFAELIAWRLYVRNRCGLSDAIMPMSMAWDAVSFEAKNAFTKDGWLQIEEGKDMPRLRFGDTIDWRLHLHEAQPSFLAKNALLFCAARYEMSHLVAEDYYHPGSGVSAEKLADDLEKEAVISLEDALQIYGSAVEPPGLSLQSYYNMNGALIGHGFSCKAIRGHLKDVFLDTESLLNASCALWRCEPVEKWAAKVLPATIFAGEFRDPLRPPRSQPKKDFDEHLERIALSEALLQSLPTHAGKIFLGHDVMLASAMYTRWPTQITVKEIDGLLGLHLLDAHEILENYYEWLHALIPYALDEAMYACLCRTFCTFSDLKAKEGAWSEEAGALDTVQRLANLTSAHATPIFAYGAEVQRQWEGRWLDEAIARTDAFIRRACPVLNNVEKPRLGEYALEYFGKDGLPSEVTEEVGIEFLQYVILRNLGLDPYYYFPESQKDWLAIFRLVRLALMKVDGENSKIEVMRVAAEARTLLRKSGELLRFFEELDTSYSTSRITVHETLLARSNASRK